MEKNNYITSKERISDRVKKALPIIVFVTFTCLFYGPLSLYLPNAEEIWFDIYTLLKVIVPFSLFAITLMLIFFCFLPEKVGLFFRLLLFGVSLALYVQGNWLKSDYGTGVLDGSEIDWALYNNYKIFNTIVWIALIILPFVMYFIIPKIDKKLKISVVISTLAIFLTMIQIPACIVQLLSYTPNKNSELKISTEGMFEVSNQHNIIYVLLDAMDELYVDTYLEDHPEYVNQLNGFIHFTNTAASGYSTLIGLPSMFTGQPFLREQVYSDYIYEIWSKDNAFSALYDAGYKVKIYGDNETYAESAIRFVDNFKKETSEVSSYKILLKKIYKLDLFRFAPHVLKRYFMFNTREFIQAKKNSDRYLIDDPLFFESFHNGGQFTIDHNSDKAFTLYHLNGAHSPFTMDSDTSKIKKSTREKQVEGCFAGVKDMLNDLREKGLYDSATIILSADHGEKNGGAHPFLMIKEKDAKGEYRICTAPISLFDISVYLAGLVNKELPNQQYGEKIFNISEQENRDRFFFKNSTSNNRVKIDEYIINGNIYDSNNIVHIREYTDPKGKDTPYKLGTELSFTGDATGNRYATEGFFHNTGFRTILYTKKSVLSIPIENPPKDGYLTVSINFYETSKPYFTEFYAGGQKIMELDIDKEIIRDGIVYDVPVDCIKDGILELEFRIPDAPVEGDAGFVGDGKYTLSIVSMTIDTKK